MGKVKVVSQLLSKVFFCLLVSSFLITPPFLGAGEVSPPGSSQPITFLNSETRVWEDSVTSGYDVFHVRRGDLELTRLGTEYQAFGNVGYSAGSETWEEYLYLGQQRIARVIYGTRNLWSLRASVNESLACEYGTLNASLTLYSRGSVPDHVLFTIPGTTESCDKTNPSSLSEVSPGIWQSTWSCSWTYSAGWPYTGGPLTVEMTAFLGSEESTIWKDFDAPCSQEDSAIDVTGTAMIQRGTIPRDSTVVLVASTIFGVDEVVGLISDERNGQAGKIRMRIPLQHEVGDPTSWSATLPWNCGSGRFHYSFVARDMSSYPTLFDESIDMLLESRAPPVCENPTIEFYIADHLGTPRWIVDETGTIVWPAPPSDPSAPYNDQPYGKSRDLTPEQSHINPYRISGKETISATGNAATNRDPFIYFGARFYNPNASPRFISPDPSLSNRYATGFPSSFNLYSYCLDNPVYYIDPTGMAPENNNFNYNQNRIGGILADAREKFCSGMVDAFAKMGAFVADFTSIGAAKVAATGSDWGGNEYSSNERTLMGILMFFHISSRGSNSEVWRLNPFARGRAIEEAVTKQYQAQGWLALDDLTRAKNWPLVDFQKGNTLVSLKSVNTTGSTWLARMETHIDDLATRGATIDGSQATMMLDLRVQPGGSTVAQQLIQYGRDRGVKVAVTEFH